MALRNRLTKFFPATFAPPTNGTKAAASASAASSPGGGDPRTLQHVLGHQAITMTLQCLRGLPIGSRRHVSEAAKRVGLLKANLKAVK